MFKRKDCNSILQEKVNTIMDKEYKASIKTVGSVLPETKTVIAKYIELQDINLLKEEVINNNLILKSSRRRSEILFYELRKRYLKDQLKGYKENDFLYFFKNVKSDSIINLLIYYQLCLEELIVYEYITELAYSRYEKGNLGISSKETNDYLLHLKETDANVSKWSDRTIQDVRTGLIGILKDFGFVNSRIKPTFNRTFIPSLIFYYVLYRNKEKIRTINDLKEYKDFKLFFLMKNDINVLLQDAYRNEIIEYKPEQNDKEIVYKYKSFKEIIDDYVGGQIR